MLNILRCSVSVFFLCASTIVVAQNTVPAPVVTTPTVVAMPQQAVPVVRSVPAGTIVELTPLAEIASSQVSVGDRFRFNVVADIIEQGLVVIPRGSIATGVVNWKTGKAIGGKSGKFEITFESLTANGRNFPLMGKHRQEGKGNTVGALLGSIWISGRSAILQPGQIVRAMIKENTAY